DLLGDVRGDHDRRDRAALAVLARHLGPDAADQRRGDRRDLRQALGGHVEARVAALGHVGHRRDQDDEREQAREMMDAWCHYQCLRPSMKVHRYKTTTAMPTK